MGTDDSTKALDPGRRREGRRPRLLIVGDSSSIPGHGNRYEDTWVYLVKQAFPEWDVIANCEGASTTEHLLAPGVRGADCMELYQPDAIVLQLGIVDCAPRLFRRNGLAEKVVRRIPPPLARPIIGWVKKRRGRSPKNAFVSETGFEANLRAYLGRCVRAGVRRVIAIAIAWPDERMVTANPGIRPAVSRYNLVYERLQGFFPCFRCIAPMSADVVRAEHYDADGYHPSPAGHRMVFEAVRVELARLQNDEMNGQTGPGVSRAEYAASEQ